MNFRLSRFIKHYVDVLLNVQDQDICLNSLQKDWQTLQPVIEGDTAGWHYLQNPLLSVSQRRHFVQSLSNKYNLCDFTQRFLNVLAHHKKLVLFPEIMTLLTKKLEEKAGWLRLKIESAAPCAKSEQKKYQTLFEAITTKKIMVELAVNPSLFAGAVFSWDRFQLDACLRTRLDLLRQQLETERPAL